MSEPLRGRRAPPAPRPGGAVTLSALSLAFLKIAMASLGGGLSAWALRVIVEERRWLTEEEFLAAYTICRDPSRPEPGQHGGLRRTPLSRARRRGGGPRRPHAGPARIVLGLGVLYFGHRKTPGLQATMAGLVAAAAGMTLSVGVKLSLGYVRQPVALLLALAAFAGVAVMRWPLLLVLGVLGPIAIAWYWPRERDERAAGRAA